jgi:DNA polymerase I-like protein with 3'-5' exonuclease and polymerase domains
MRTDSQGMFWHDTPRVRKGGERVLGPMPRIPETGWKKPKDFPNILSASIIGLDTETYDPHLKKYGPGWARRQRSEAKRAEGVPDYLHAVGSLVGVSVAVHEKAWYFPMRHTINPEENMNPENVLAWLRDMMKGTQPKIGTNLIYDIGWLQEEGVTVNGPLLDIGYAEALLTETGSLSLDAIANKYLSMGKETNLLYQWCQDWYGGSTDQRRNIWRSPPSLVGAYAEGDALLPLRAFEIQKGLLEQQGLYETFDMECRLIRLLLAMRMRGVKVDLDHAEKVDKGLTDRIAVVQQELNTVAGMEVDTNKASSIAPAFDKAGLKYFLTPVSKKPSFTNPFLKEVTHPISKLIQEVRRCIKLRDTFIRSYILESHVGGRIHGQYHLVRNEGYGTRSGRLSSSNPNLTNIPSRDPVWGHQIRECFIPEYGCQWLRYDYSQIEYRLLLHFAVGEGAAHTIQMYHDDPTLNYHSEVKNKLLIMTGRDIPYKITKNINFGLIYGMGNDTLRRELQMTMPAAKALFKDYHNSVPYVKSTMDYYTKQTQRDGYISTLLGRRSRFELWEPKNYQARDIPMTFDRAVREYGNAIQRAQLHKALNRLLQGSAADLIKKAMLTCFEEGIFDGDRLPLLTVHDELDFSAQNPRDPIWGQVREVMEEGIQLKIPVRTEVELGPNWGKMVKIA